MNNTRQVLEEMRASADAMSPRSGIRSALEKWLPRLSEALQSDVRLQESASAPRSASPRYDETVHGIFDVREAQERRTYAQGQLQNVYTRAQVDRHSQRPFGSYPDLHP